MSRTLTISDEVYGRLQEEARARGFDSVERMLEEWGRKGGDLGRRAESVKKIDELRQSLLSRYGQMADSTELLREDRAR